MHGTTQDSVIKLDASRLRMIGRRRAMEQWLYEGHLENPYDRGMPEYDGFDFVAAEIDGQEMSDQQMRGYC